MIYAVTGLMRSGTSFLARSLHRLGIKMGNEMHFPVGASDPDWEDVPFTDTLAKALVDGRTDVTRFLREYIEQRGPGTWGVKSPFLLPFVEQLRWVGGSGVRILLTKRPLREACASLERQLEGAPQADKERIRGMQMELDEAWLVGQSCADAVFECAESRLYPDRVRERLRVLVKG